MAINISLAINFLASAGAERGDDKMIIVTAGAIHEQIVALARAGRDFRPNDSSRP
jgi:hypothetical protein